MVTDSFIQAVTATFKCHTLFKMSFIMTSTDYTQTALLVGGTSANNGDHHFPLV